MKTQQFQTKKIKVHQTMTAAYIASYAPQIAKYVCSFIPLYEKVGFASFSMDKETGYWRYQQYVEKIPKFFYKAKTRAEAEETMATFFKQVNERIDNAIANKQLPEDFPTLFGQYQVLQSVQAIEQLPQSDKAKIWEFRYSINLPSVDYIKPVDERTEEILASEKAIVMGNEIVIRFSGNHLIDVQYSRLPMFRTKRKQMFNLLGEPDTVGEYQKAAKVIFKAFPKIAMILPFVQTINGELLPVTEEGVAAMERATSNKNEVIVISDMIMDTNETWVKVINTKENEKWLSFESAEEGKTLDSGTVKILTSLANTEAGRKHIWKLCTETKKIKDIDSKYKFCLREETGIIHFETGKWLAVNAKTSKYIFSLPKIKGQKERKVCICEINIYKGILKYYHGELQKVDVFREVVDVAPKRQVMYGFYKKDFLYDTDRALFGYWEKKDYAETKMILEAEGGNSQIKDVEYRAKKDVMIRVQYNAAFSLPFTYDEPKWYEDKNIKHLDNELQMEIFLAVTAYHESELHAFRNLGNEEHKSFILEKGDYGEYAFYLSAYPVQTKWVENYFLLNKKD